MKQKLVYMVLLLGMVMGLASLYKYYICNILIIK